jgi:dihydrofolate reductase
MLRMISSVTVVRDLAAAQLLHELRLVIFPLVLGPDSQEPIFAGHLRTNLELEGSRFWTAGCRRSTTGRSCGEATRRAGHETWLATTHGAATVPRSAQGKS